MENPLIHAYSSVLEKLKKGKTVVLPEYVRMYNGYKKKDVEISSVEEFEKYLKRYMAVYEWLSSNYSKDVAVVYANAFKMLTGPKNTTLAGKLLSGIYKSSKIFKSANKSLMRDSVFASLNTDDRDFERILGFVSEPKERFPIVKVKRTSLQTTALLEKGIGGYYLPLFDKDGIVVEVGDGKNYFDPKFVFISSRDVSEDEVREYLWDQIKCMGKAIDYVKYEDYFVSYVENLIELSKTAYGDMCLSDGMYQSVRDIIHESMRVFPLSFSSVLGNKKEGRSKPPKSNNPIFQLEGDLGDPVGKNPEMESIPEFEGDGDSHPLHPTFPIIPSFTGESEGDIDSITIPPIIEDGFGERPIVPVVVPVIITTEEEEVPAGVIPPLDFGEGEPEAAEIPKEPAEVVSKKVGYKVRKSGLVRKAFLNERGEVVFEEYDRGLVREVYEMPEEIEKT